MTRKKSRKQSARRKTRPLDTASAARAQPPRGAAEAPSKPAPARVDDWLPPERAAAPVPAESLPAAPEMVAAPNHAWLFAADLASLAVIGALAFFNIAGAAAGVRVLVALAFVTFVPGWALARASGLASGLTGIAVSVLASLTICAAASTAMVWLDAWHPFILFTVLSAVSSVLLLWTLPPAFVAARMRA